jgi:hypothetical protein
MARPAGEVSLALLRSAAQLATPERAPTMRELAHHAMVGVDAANVAVKNLKRSGRLVPVRLRQVRHRTRPVAEYAPAPDTTFDHQVIEDDSRHGAGWVDLGRCVAGWAR